MMHTIVTATTRTPTGAQAVDRAARLLADIVDSPVAPSFSELAASSGLARSTTSRLLLALERNGLVERGEAGGYLPGELFVRYGWRSDREADLVRIATPHLERLGELTGETVNLGVESRQRVEQIAQVDSRYLLGGTNWVGRPVPLHCSALGKVLLAYGAVELPAGRLERLTDCTITSRAALSAELDEVRRRGYAVTNEELEPGLVAVAAPVLGRGGEAVAAVAVSGPVTRLGGARVNEAAARCMDTAHALSELLGHRRQKVGAA